MTFLDNTGLAYLFGKIKALFGASLGISGTTLSLKNKSGTVLSSVQLPGASSTVTGVKGSAESAYRTGDVSLSAANVGAAAASHTHAYLPLTGGALTGNVTVMSPASEVSQFAVQKGTSYHALVMNNDGSGGIYSSLTGGYPLYISSSGGIQFNGVASAAVRSQNDQFYLGTTSVSLQGQSDNVANMRCTQLQVRNTAHTAWAACYASAFGQQSSIKYKKNIKDMDVAFAENILKLRAVRYDYINEDDGVGCAGFIAEEVAQLQHWAVMFDENGECEGIDYSKFVPQMVLLLQKQQWQIDELKKELEALNKASS